jgi:hypothetical protein
MKSIESELENYTVAENGCWIYNGPRMGQMGYAQILSQSGHRLAYRRAKGEITSNLDVGHTCDCPPCINPDHLVLQTRSENIKQAFDRNRGKSNWDKAVHAPGTEEFSKRVAAGVSKFWANMTDKERAIRGQQISEGKLRQSKRSTGGG